MKGLGLIAVVAILYLILRGSRAGAESASANDGLVQPPPFVPSPAPSTSGSDALDNFGQAIFQYEKANPSYNNPGALENRSGQFIQYADQGDGWDALNSYITRHAAANPQWDFYDFFQNYLGQKQGGPTVTDQGDSDAYAEYVANYMGVYPTDTVSSVLGS